MPSYTKRQWLILIVMGLSDFFNAICVSLQAPFFPQEAELKGSNATEYGLVFGIFELVVCLSSPLYGKFLKRIGPKALFNAGVFTTGTSAILFGLLDRIPGHIPFITLAFTIRIIEALGNAAFLTASFTIIATEFPTTVGTSFATLETFFGFGLIVGPMIGGFLYSLGGYFLPFVVLGSTLFACAIVTLFILPQEIKSEGSQNSSNKSLLHVLKVPGIQVCSLGIAATSASIGFISATLEPHLRQFNLTAILIGVIFVVNGGTYATSAPFVGYFVDRSSNPKYFSIAGSLCIIIGFSLIGPISILPFDTNLAVVIIGLIFHGMGIGLLLVSTFSDALRVAVQSGFDDGIETYGLISGLWTSIFAFGAFLGPSISGYLYDQYGFRNSVYFIVILHILVAFIFTVFTLCARAPRKSYKEISPEENLIGRSNGSLHKSLPRRDSICSTQQIPVPMTMSNNMIIASSYGKNIHWQRKEEEAHMGLLADSFRDDAYGTLEHDMYARETIA